MSYEIIWEPKGTVKRFFGRVSSHEMLLSVVEAGGDERFDDMRFVINDFRDIEALELVDEEIQEILALDYGAARSNPRIRIAVVTTHAEILDFTRQYASSPLNAYPIRAFPSMAEARSWLGVQS